MTEKHTIETTESRWAIWRHQSVLIIMGLFAAAVLCSFGWILGVGL